MMSGKALREHRSNFYVFCAKMPHYDEDDTTRKFALLQAWGTRSTRPWCRPWWLPRRWWHKGPVTRRWVAISFLSMLLITCAGLLTVCGGWNPWIELRNRFPARNRPNIIRTKGTVDVYGLTKLYTKSIHIHTTSCPPHWPDRGGGLREERGGGARGWISSTCVIHTILHTLGHTRNDDIYMLF